MTNVIEMREIAHALLDNARQTILGACVNGLLAARCAAGEDREDAFVGVSDALDWAAQQSFTDPDDGPDADMPDGSASPFIAAGSGLDGDERRALYVLLMALYILNPTQSVDLRVLYASAATSLREASEKS